MERINKNNKKLPGVWGEAVQFEDILPELSSAIIANKIVSLRIADQPPYGYVFRVDNKSLVNNVWRAKKRLTEYGEIDLEKKPVTSLSDEQLHKFIDWKKLGDYGFQKEDVDLVLNLNLHTILPVNKNIPEHLVTQTRCGPTISTIKFAEEDRMRKIVDGISLQEPKAIVGGTSLNIDGKMVVVDSGILLANLSDFPVVDLFVISDFQQDNLNLGAHHSMVALEENQTVSVRRRGIGMERIIQLANIENLHIIGLNK